MTTELGYGVIDLRDLIGCARELSNYSWTNDVDGDKA